MLSDIYDRRGRHRFDGHTHNFIELYGGKPIDTSFYEPDPNTFRANFYYNTRENRIFKRMKAGNLYVWKDVSEC